MNYCGIHRTLQFGSKTCKDCKIERLESEILAEKMIQDMLKFKTEPLTKEDNKFILSVKEQIIKTNIERLRLITT